MNETPRRFTRQSARGNALSLSEPLPSLVAALLSDRVQAHRKVATRLLALQTEAVEARRALEAARVSDERAKVKAASEDKPQPRAQKSASAEKRLEAVEDELRAFANALAESADRVLAAALPHLREARTRGVDEQRHERERTEELRAALDRSLERQQTLAGELRWIDVVESSNGRVEPYREVALGQDLGHVRAGIRELFAELSVKRERREAEAKRQREWEDEQREVWRAREEQARRQAAEERIVVADGVVVAKGGRLVRRTGFGFQEAEEEA
jgi:hypothetical protein